MGFYSLAPCWSKPWHHVSKEVGSHCLSVTVGSHYIMAVKNWSIDSGQDALASLELFFNCAGSFADTTCTYRATSRLVLNPGELWLSEDHQATVM